MVKILKVFAMVLWGVCTIYTLLLSAMAFCYFFLNQPAPAEILYLKSFIPQGWGELTLFLISLPTIYFVGYPMFFKGGMPELLLTIGYWFVEWNSAVLISVVMIVSLVIAVINWGDRPLISVLSVGLFGVLSFALTATITKISNKKI